MIGLKLRNLDKHFAGRGGIDYALHGVSLDIAPSQFVIVIGPNGSGKSSLLRAIAGSLELDGGTITAVERTREFNWLRLGQRRRGRIAGYVHQDPRTGSVGDFTVVENLRFARLSGFPSLVRRSGSAAERRAIVDALKNSPLAARAFARADELSHGQRQLLALEMTLARRPRLILFDEHTASLDRANSDACMRRASELHDQTGATLIMVTHDLGIALKYGDRLIALRDGQVRADLHGAAKSNLKLADILAYLDMLPS